MRIDNSISEFSVDATAWHPVLRETTEPGSEVPCGGGVVETRFADWGLGLVVDLKFGGPDELAAEDRAHLSVASPPTAPSIVPPGPPTAPYSPPVAPPTKS